MVFRILQAYFAVVLAASAAHGQVVEDKPTPPEISVHYGQVISPETFSFNENVAWAVRSLLRPEETLGKAVVMYGYPVDHACDVDPQQIPDVPAALALPLRSSTDDVVWADLDRPYSVTLYKTAGDACGALDFAKRLANIESNTLNSITGQRQSDQITFVSWYAGLRAPAAAGEVLITIPGFLPVDNDTAASFARELRKIEAGKETNSSLLFSVGKLPGAGEGLELWAFCDEAERCLGHEADDIFVARNFAGIVNPVNWRGD